MTKPSLFIGSSKEGLEVARAVEWNLHDDAEVTIWTENVFGLPGFGTLESLVTVLGRFDFAAIVISPDDFVLSRDVVSKAPRDNIMFELGLFMGGLGRSRTFAVCSSSPTMKLPSDLAGVTLARYTEERADKNIMSALGPACTMIRQVIRDLGQGPNKTAQKITHLESRQADIDKEQQEQKSIIEQIVKFSPSLFCYDILWHIARGEEYVYKNDDDNMRRQMWFLADSGYLAPREPRDSLSFDEGMHLHNVCKEAKLTPIGEKLVELRGDPWILREP
jgi:hypothetical protein